jgi:diguanylate cyclase (GGDEF)-like protein
MLREFGDRDGLTGCFNRRRFNEAMARRIAPRAEATRLGVLLMDIDHFKAINDQRGHLEGDRVLAAAPSSTATVARSSRCSSAGAIPPSSGCSPKPCEARSRLVAMGSDRAK